VQRAHHAEGALVMILELARGNDRHRHGRPLGSIAVARPGLGMGAMAEGAHHVVNHHKDRYNHLVVHRALLRRWVVQAPPFSGMNPMNDY